MTKRIWSIYLSGEIHSDWREQIIDGAAEKNLPVEFSSPNTNHQDSDDCGAIILGDEESKFWHDNKSAKINAIRTRTLISEADIVVVRFGEKYRQWNAAFDAGFASALDIPTIIMHQDEHQHALKEVDASALAVTKTPKEVVDILAYVIEGKL